MLGSVCREGGGAGALGFEWRVAWWGVIGMDFQ